MSGRATTFAWESENVDVGYSKCLKPTEYTKARPSHSPGVTESISARLGLGLNCRLSDTGHYTGYSSGTRAVANRKGQLAKDPRNMGSLKDVTLELVQ